MTESTKLQTKAEYYATIAAIRSEVQKLDSQPIASTSQAKDIASRMVALTRQADDMERAAAIDGTVKLNWQLAAQQRQEEREVARFKQVQAMDKSLNPTKYIDPNIMHDHLNSSVDLFSGLSHPAKLELIGDLLAGNGVVDKNGNTFVPYNGGRATLHNDEGGDYVSFVGTQNNAKGEGGNGE